MKKSMHQTLKTSLKSLNRLTGKAEDVILSEEEEELDESIVHCTVDADFDSVICDYTLTGAVVKVDGTLNKVPGTLNIEISYNKRPDINGFTDTFFIPTEGAVIDLNDRAIISNSLSEVYTKLLSLLAEDMMQETALSFSKENFESFGGVKECWTIKIYFDQDQDKFFAEFEAFDDKFMHVAELRVNSIEAEIKSIDGKMPEEFIGNSILKKILQNIICDRAVEMYLDSKMK